MKKSSFVVGIGLLFITSCQKQPESDFTMSKTNCYRLPHVKKHDN